jgi:hypothetical protein
MTGGIIRGNGVDKTDKGGGVSVAPYGEFNMSGGTISGNSSPLVRMCRLILKLQAPRHCEELSDEAIVPALGLLNACLHAPSGGSTKRRQAVLPDALPACFTRLRKGEAAYMAKV